ncbi:MAG: glycosyltransferase family 9 protein [Ignavibacteria bacterium]|nr:glycosyltransferase family 9 protein [Ignavibacteria bacterium]
MKPFLQFLEHAVRNAFVYPVFRIVLRKRPIDGTIELSRVRKLLILRHDRIGDMIVSTPVFRALKRLHPDLHLGVFASRSNVQIIRHNPYVDAIYIAYPNPFRLFAEARRARREGYDVVLSFVFNRTTTVAMLARLAAPSALKYGHADERYRFYFDRLVKLPRFSVHMVESLAAYVKEVFGTEIQSSDLKFEIFIDQSSRQGVDLFLRKRQLRRRSDISPGSSPYVVFNVSATDEERRISVEQAKVVAKHLSTQQGFKTVVIHAPGDREMESVVREESDFGECLAYPGDGSASLLEIASVVDGALGVLTPDTAIVHFASAAGVPVLGFFTTVQGMNEWLPYQVPYELVIAPEGQAASRIPTAMMLQKIDEFVQRFVPQPVLPVSS